MSKHTNPLAFQSTSPVINTATHQIVSEHQKFYAKFDAEEEAQRKAEQANQDEFARKKAKLGFDNYKGLSAQEAKGYFTEQVLQYKNANSERWLEMAKASADGDEDATIQLAREKEKLSGLINASTTISGKVAELFDLKEKGTFNEARDKPLSDFVDSLNKGIYMITPEGKYKVYNKENDELLEVDPNKLQSDFMNSTYHKKVNFDAIGDAIAGSIKLKSFDGNKSIGEANARDGVTRILNMFKQDPNVLTTWAVSKGVNKAASELSETERNVLATRFYEEQVRSGIQEAVKTPTATGDDKEGKGVVILATDENGAPLKKFAVEGSGTFEGDIINAPEGGVKVTTRNKSSNRVTTITMFGRNKNGKLVGFGEEVVTVPAVFELNEDGTQKLDDEGFLLPPITPKTEKKQAVIISDRGELNKFAIQMDGINNLGELGEAINVATGNNKNPNAKVNTETKTSAFDPTNF